MVMKIHIMVFWVVMPYSDMVGYQCFGGPCCLHLKITTWSHNPEDLDFSSAYCTVYHSTYPDETSVDFALVFLLFCRSNMSMQCDSQ